MVRKGKGVLLTIIIFILIAVVGVGIYFALRGINNNSNENDIDIYYQGISLDEVVCENDIYYADSRILITATEEVSYGEIEKMINDLGGDIIGYISTTNDYQIRFRDKKTYEELEKIVDDIKSNSSIELASIEYITELTTNSVNYTTDPWIDANKDSDTSGREWSESNPDGSNWWAEAICMPSVWGMDLNTEKVKVGIIDSTFDITNEDLDNGLFKKLWNNPADENGDCNVTELYNEASDNYNKSKDKEEKEYYQELKSYYSHGTHVAGIIAARNNGFGITGINQNVELYGYAVFSDEADRSIDNSWCSVFIIECAISRLLNENVKVINISLGETDALVGAQNGNSAMMEYLELTNNSFENFLMKYIDMGKQFLICKSAGNDSKADDREKEIFGKKYDAYFDMLSGIENEEVKNRIIVVGAAERVDNYYNIAYFSNRGDRVDVYAPGVSILSDMPNNVTALKDGTSMSTPIVSGIASLIWGINPKLSPYQVKNIIMATTSNYAVPDDLDEFCYPTAIVNANLAVRLAEMTKNLGFDSEVKNFGTVTGLIYDIENLSMDDNKNIKITLYNNSGKELKSITAEKIFNSVEEENISLYSYIELLEPGDYSLEVLIEGYVSQKKEFTIEANETEVIDFEMISDKYIVTDAYRIEINGQTYAIPKINLEGNNFKRINSEINIIYSGDEHSQGIIGNVEDIRNGILPRSSCYNIDYEWGLNGDIISICIEFQFDGGSRNYQIYNISRTTGENVSREDILNYKGWTYEQYAEKVKYALGSVYWDKYYDMLTGNESSAWLGEGLAQNKLDNTISDNNVSEAIPYLNENSELCVAGFVYSLAGADRYYHKVNLETFEMSPHYSENVELPIGGDSSSSNEYSVYVEVINNLLSETNYNSQKDYIKQIYSGNLVDFDKNGTDELVLFYTTDGLNVLGQVWSIQNGKAVCMLNDINVTVMAGQPDSEFCLGSSGGKEYICLYRQFGDTFTERERWQLFEVNNNGYVLKRTLEKVCEHMGSDGKYTDTPVSEKYMIDNAEVSKSDFDKYKFEEKEVLCGIYGTQIEEFISQLQ